MAAPMIFDMEVKTTDAKKGKGLFAKRQFKEGDVILDESPIVSCQFAWNEFYKYKACEYCLRSLETAEAMAQRLTENYSLILPHPECCEVSQDQIVTCPQCGAEDPTSVLTSFSQFVQVTVNEEEHAVHKLLGKQFQVYYGYYNYLIRMLQGCKNSIVIYS
ncbi:histone-lysine N-trimethyltransferase SMYD5-like [Ruditapes philippinarum]|uniref:histone-lysine N-trimethyltransferase SMYD5-like n=1 Tax=Ruditapes philippinarum TaxID=129788 RepID=UPI00295BDDF7|nr:histone-lysine N-trimethyltransferase SMYD5-like [Ruditapes philippinarum]